jgi:hypothetical protein
MTDRLNIGNGARIGALTAVLVLSTGLLAANADELSDLRASQQLVQQRIDQLPPGQPQAAPPQMPGATGPNGYDTPATPDQPLPAGSFPRSYLIPGTSTSVRVGGSVDETLRYGGDR